MIGLIFDLLTYYEQRKMAKDRNPEEAIKSFQESLAEYDPTVVLKVYKEIQSHCMYGQFPLLPRDELLNDLNIDQGSLENIIEELEHQGEYPVTSKDLAVLLLKNQAI